MTNVEVARTIVNPIIKDRVTFIETAAESFGKRTFVEVELAPGGGNGMHYHKNFTETFTVVEGVLGVQVGKQIMDLQVGESATVQVREMHRFFNVSQSERVVFTVELAPGHIGFERCLQVAYGLAVDGRVTKDGIPKSIYHLALILEWGDTQIPGFFALLKPFLGWIAKRAEKKGIAKELIDEYCKF